MAYVALVVWICLIIFAGMGVYSLLSRLIPPRWLNWLLLPGTIISEMAYIFGCLITGGEVRSKILPSKGEGKKAPGAGTAAPPTDAKHAGKFAGPMVASMIAIVACGIAVLAANATLSVKSLTAGLPELPSQLPQSWNGFWDLLRYQITLLEATTETLRRLTWSNWRVSTFVYLTVCLAVRLAPARRPIRPTLAATVVIATLAAIVAAVSSRFAYVLSDIWPLVTYVWAMLLFLLAATLVLTAIVTLVRLIAGKGAK